MILRINNFQNGLTSSPYSYDGVFSKMVNLDVIGQKGIMRINYLPTQETGNTLIGSYVPKMLAKNPDSGTDVYATDSVGRVISSTDSGNTWTSLATGKGDQCIVWKDHLIISDDTTLKTYGPLSGSPAWDDTFQTLNSTAEHFMFHSKNDDKLYICNGNDANGLGIIASLEQVGGQNFDDATAGTYTWTASALTLPEGYEPLCLSEQRENLLVGTAAGASAAPLQEASIFVWDRALTEYDFPVTVPEGFISSMINSANRVFVAAGNDGKIYQFSEAGLVEIAQIPFDYDNNKGVEVGVYGRQSLAVWKGNLVIGINTDDGLAPGGVYILELKTGKLSHGFIPSTLRDGSASDLRVGGVYAFDNNSLLIGYYDAGQTSGQEGQIDRVLDTNNRYTSYAAYGETPIYRIGTKLNPESFQQIEIQLARPLQVGEGVRLKYRKNVNASWTTIGTMDFATQGAITSFVFNYAIQGIENIQVRVELTTGATVNTPYLQEIIFQ